MHIEQVQYAAFRGQSATHALAPATLIVGANGAGKTTLKHAIQLAILGFIPGRSKVDKTPYANAIVRVQLGDGDYIERQYVCKGGSVKETVNTSLAESDIETLSTPTLDASEYFGLGPTDQVQYIFSRMELPDTHSAKGILQELGEADFPEFETEHVTAAKADVKKLAEDALAIGIADGLQKLTGEKGTLSGELKMWKARAKDTLGNLRISTELQARAGECSAETLADLRARIEKNGGAMAEAQQAAGALSSRKMAANKVVLRRKELEQALLLRPIAHTEDIAKLREEIKTLNDNRLVVTDLKPITDYQQAYDKALAEQEIAGVHRDSAVDALADAEEAEHGFDALTECPTCKSKAKNWKERVLGGLRIATAAARGRVPAAEENVKRAAEAFNLAKQDLAEVREMLAHNDASNSAIANKQRQIERLEYADNSATQQRQQQQDELTRLSDQDAPTPEQLQEVSEHVQVIGVEARNLAAKLDAATRLQHEIATAAKGEQEHAKAKAFQAVFEDAKKRLKARQVSTIDAMFQGLLERANYFTQGIIPEPLVFRDGEIGRVVHNEFVSAADVAGFSDAERGITYVAVASALAMQSPFKLAIIDEVKIDPEKLALVMRRLAQAIGDGIINQALVTHTEEVPECEGWSVVRIGKGVAA